MEKDAGFREAVNLLVELGLAGGKPDPVGQLAAAGIAIPERTSVVEVALAVGRVRARTSFGSVGNSSRPLAIP